LPVTLIPLYEDASRSICSGFAVETEHCDPPVRRREFSRRSWGPVARRAVQRLSDTGGLPEKGTVYYELVAECSENTAVRSPPQKPVFTAEIKPAPLDCRRIPLRPLLETAQPREIHNNTLFPVFYTAQALKMAERCARSGANSHPPVESGAVLLGPLCVCPDSGEFFCIIDEILEVQAAEATARSLSYTDRSWHRIQTMLRSRRETSPATRILGQCHGHNFRPNSGRFCEPCRERPVCLLNNLFVSREDQEWSRAVFAHQPWQLCHIFGWTARGDAVDALFGLEDARLQERGFFVLPEFKPDPS
jgi:hypothetical protein